MRTERLSWDCEVCAHCGQCFDEKGVRQGCEDCGFVYCTAHEEPLSHHCLEVESDCARIHITLEVTSPR